MIIQPFGGGGICGHRHKPTDVHTTAGWVGNVGIKTQNSSNDLAVICFVEKCVQCDLISR